MRPIFTFPLPRVLRVVSAMCLWLLGGMAQAQFTGAFSFHETPTTPADYRVTVDGACVGCAVNNAARAGTARSDDFATISSVLGLPLTTRVSLRLRLNGQAPAGAVAGIVLGSDRALDLVTLNTLRVRTYQNNTARETKSAANAVELKAFGPNRYVVEFTSSQAFNWVELQLGGLTDALTTLDVYYAYATPVGTSPLGVGRYSRFESPVRGTDYSSQINGLCVLCSVTNPSRAADENLTAGNYATLQTTAGVLASTSLRLRLEVAAPAGSIAGMVISTGSLLDVDVLNSLTLRTYSRNAAGKLVLQETVTAANLLVANLLTGNRYALNFTSTAPFEYVELSVGSLVSLLNTVRVYYAYGLPGASAPLPVELVGFTAQPLADGSVHLKWQTASERANEKFVVERADNPDALVAIGEVAGHGTSTAPHTYTYLDGGHGAGHTASPLPPGGGLVYYRLRQQDFGGSQHLSVIVPVRLRAGGTPAPLQAYPNPAHAQLTVRVGANSAPSASTAQVVTLVDATGRTVRTLTLPVNATETTFSVQDLPPGAYTLQTDGQRTSLLITP